MTVVAEHIAVPVDRRDLGWLADALQTAIALEHSTLPLYLAGMFSLRVQNYTAYNAIRSVVMEEMAHMASAANILAAIGGAPRIAELDPGFPSRGLPGGAEPDLVARLAPLSKRQLESFMRIETPAFLLADRLAVDPSMDPSKAARADADGEPYPTIGSLYQAIGEAVDRNGDELRAAIRRGGRSNQVGDDIGVATIDASGGGGDPLAQVHSAIAQIVEQGEGSPTRTLHAGVGSEDEESHYCKFAELYYGRRYRQPAPPLELSAETEPQFFTGPPIPFPEVVNTLTVPTDGYAKALAVDPNGAAVEHALRALDVSYTEMMSDLEAVWNGPSERAWPTLGKAVTTMSGMRVLACFQIVKHEVPPDVVARLDELYPGEHAELAAFTDLSRPVLYGPRFANLNHHTER